MNPYALLTVGLLLIWLEFYLPGGVMGISGAIMVITSIVLYSIEAASPIHTAIFALVSFLLVGFLIKFTLKRIQNTSSKKTIYLDSDQEGYVATSFDESLIGKEGKAITDLKPSGHAHIEGQDQQVIAQAGYIEKGSKVVVISGQGPSLIVKEIP